MQLTRVVEVSARVAATRSRTDKVAMLAELIAALGSEVGLGVAYLSGATPQGRIGIGWAAVRAVDVAPAPADRPHLTLADVDRALDTLAAATGPGSRDRRARVLETLLGQATAGEQAFLQRVLLGELRHGALDGVVVTAIAQAADLPVAAVRRAYMLSDDLGAVAAAALDGGSDALAAFRLRVLRPVQPMLAQTAADVGTAMDGAATVVVDAKIDGARLQVHRDGHHITAHTRSLRDITADVPGIVALVADLPVDRVILDGEVVWLDADGRPAAFQDTMARLGEGGHDDGADGASSTSSGAPAGGTTVRFFDCLHHDGTDLIDAPLSRRLAVLDRVVATHQQVPRLVTDQVADAEAFFEQMVADGFEGVVIKDPDAAYAAGRRGGAWRKIKPVHTLDLVVLAAEWGSGRRQGWLSNLHLGARDPGGGFVMLGKTFKGLTDELLTWQTLRLLALETRREGHVVHVEPALVVEIAFDGVQTSSRYSGGMVLRFARVRRYRDDRTAADADTIERVRAFHQRR